MSGSLPEKSNGEDTELEVSPEREAFRVSKTKKKVLEIFVFCFFSVFFLARFRLLFPPSTHCVITGPDSKAFLLARFYNASWDPHCSAGSSKMLPRQSKEKIKYLPGKDRNYVPSRFSCSTTACRLRLLDLDYVPS